MTDLINTLRLILSILFLHGIQARAVTYSNLGAPVRGAMHLDSKLGTNQLLYSSFLVEGGRMMLTEINPTTAAINTYYSSVDDGAYAIIHTTNNCVFLGTLNGNIVKYNCSDPTTGLVGLGKPSANELYIWQFADGGNGKIYGATYPSCKLVSCDINTGELDDLGRMSETCSYGRYVASKSGKIYIGCGYQNADIVVYRTALGTSASIMDASNRVATVARVFVGNDNEVYATCGARKFWINDETLVLTNATDNEKWMVMSNGKAVTIDGMTNLNFYWHYTGPVYTNAAINPDNIELYSFAEGPDGAIYGTSSTPEYLWKHSTTNSQLGNPTVGNGEAYSYLLNLNSKLYIGSYPNSYLSIYDPLLPWDFGTNPTNNPYGYGPIVTNTAEKDYYSRPVTMVLGPSNRVYIGNIATYGMLGGGLAEFDPVSQLLVTNWVSPLTNHSIASMVYDSQSNLLWVGSSIKGGNSATPVATSPKIYSFSTTTGVMRTNTPVATDVRISSLVLIDRVLHGVSNNNNVTTNDNIFAYNVDTDTFITNQVLSYGVVKDYCFARNSYDGMIYGCTADSIFRYNPSTYAITKVGDYSGITSGFAIKNNYIYFGAGTNLIKASLDTPISRWKLKRLLGI